MKQYIQYLKYVIMHKWYVAKECFQEGLYWKGITHDMSKFLPSEFIPYANFFYNNSTKKGRDKTGYYKPTDTGDIDFDFAWLLHQKRNRHHWQWWILPEDDGGIKVLKMSNNNVTEMICDWVGAGKAQGFHSPSSDKYYETRQWYLQNKSKMNLHLETRAYIEQILLRSFNPSKV